MKRLAVLVSGRGSNLGAVLSAHRRGDIPAEICAVVSNVAAAPALEVAKGFSVPTQIVRHQDFASREAFDSAVVSVLRGVGAEVVLLAGFMRLLTRRFCEAFPETLNVHPSLLPAFPGAHAVRDALAYGAKVTGVSVHFVELATDGGPIIAQEAVAVLPGDSESSLLERLHAVEHRLVPQAVADACAGRLVRKGRLIEVLR